MRDSKKSSLQIIKNNNKNLILKLIHDSECISRAELRKITGLAPTTVSTLVDEFIESGIVKETGVLDTGGIGRKAVSIEINASGMHFAGVEIENEKIVVDIYDLRFNMVYHKETETGSYNEILGFIVSTLKNAEKELKIEISSVVIGVSGIIDTKNNKILISTVMDITDENFAEDITAEFPKAYVALLNASGLIAYAEKEKRKVRDLVTVDIGKGVGAGIIIDGKIYNGSGGTAGEFGHISIDMNGEKCKCGNRGCTELYTNTHVIRRKAALILGEEKVSLARVRDEALSGNKEIINELERVAEILSFALAGLVNMMAPERIVISGRITELGEVFLTPLKKAVGGKCSLRQTKIEYAAVSGNAVTLGGAFWAFEKMIDRI